MSSGAVIQLVAQGLQDVYLTGDPQLTFFKQVYKRHTNFALDSVRQVFKGTPAPGNVSRATLKRAGDLVNGMYLIVDGAALPPATLGNMIDRVELHIGGQKIDEYSGFASPTLQTNAIVPKASTGTIPTLDTNKFLPLHFFCCDGYNSPLPLVALQYHDVEVIFYWSQFVANQNLTLYANYTYLDSKERDVFAQNKHEILITQHQEITWDHLETIIDLTFTHPIKVLIITDAEPQSGVTYSVKGPVPSPATTTRLTLELNGQQRFEPQTSVFFQSVNPYYYGSPHGYIDYVGNEGNYIYSFALNYGQAQPSGTLNFSRVDNARLHITFGNLLCFHGDKLRCLAINYNILKCENGMGGLLFAN